MAKCGDDSPDPIKCGNCLEEEGYLLNPKVIPCSHIFCEECIRGQAEKTDTFTCKVCKEQTKFMLEDLPSALTHPTFCDVCEKKGKKNMTARAYCVKCESKYCGRHEEAHSDFSAHHEVLSIEKYLESEFAAEHKYCDKHKDQRLVIGCSGCWKICCLKCVSSMGSCENGGYHVLMSSDELSEECKKKMEPQKKIAEEKFTKWTAVMDEMTDSVENWDKETEEGLRLIDETENKQLTALKEKYTKLRAEYVKQRNETKEKIASYLDGDAGQKFAEFHKQLRTLREMLDTAHNAVLVIQRDDLERRVDDLVKADFPALVLENQRRVTITEEYRSPEIELNPSDDLVVGGHMTNIRDPPTAIQLIKQVGTSSYCNTVCYYKENIYDGLENGAIERIDMQGQVTSSFIKLASAIITVRAHNNQLFILMNGNPYKVYVYDMAGTQIRSWDHGDSYGYYYGNKLLVMGDNLLIADVTNRRISVYTTAGDTVRHMPCPAISANTYTAMCAGVDDCVIISHYSPPRVHKYNLTTGAIDWISDKTTSPSCVKYFPPVVLVSGAGFDKTCVWILDYTTGGLLREISDQRVTASNVFDLCVYGDTLLVPRYHERSVLYYKMIQEVQQ